MIIQSEVKTPLNKSQYSTNNKERLYYKESLVVGSCMITIKSIIQNFNVSYPKENSLDTVLLNQSKELELIYNTQQLLMEKIITEMIFNINIVQQIHMEKQSSINLAQMNIQVKISVYFANKSIQKQSKNQKLCSSTAEITCASIIVAFTTPDYNGKDLEFLMQSHKSYCYLLHFIFCCIASWFFVLSRMRNECDLFTTQQFHHSKIFISFQFSYFSSEQKNQFGIIALCIFDSFYQSIQFLKMIGQRIVREQQQKMVKKIKHYIYDPEEMIGSGFSSKVFKGANQMTQETIAIKVLELTKIQSEVEKYLLNNEINALRALSHPHILRTIEILMTKNNVYIMTEFCENGDLQQYIKKQGKLNELQALKIARDIIEGYVAIQEKQIVHRDLKTANIFLTSTGARIADFGFCEFLNETKKPQLFYNVGSPAYMSPQSYRENIYSSKSDIWSIGIILYEMLIGDTPDKNLTYSQMSNNLMMGRINCGANEQIRQILSLCFKRQLKERISTRNLIELINSQINRLNTQAAIRSQPAKMPSNSAHPVQNTPLRIQNRQLISSTLPFGEQHNEISMRGQSPIKARFNAFLAREEAGRNVDPSPAKIVVQRRFSKDEDNNKIFVKVKSVTQMLLFHYRLLNALGQVRMQKSVAVRMVLFRHRNFLEQTAQRLAQQQHLDRGSYQPLKEFHFLKSRFDESYLQRQSQQGPYQITPTLSKLQDFSNFSFMEQKALDLYNSAALQCAYECQSKMNIGDQLQMGRYAIILDYLLLHFEILQLYREGKTIDAISQQCLMLPTFLKDQPKKITPYHSALLRYKLKLATQRQQQNNNEEKHETEETSTAYKQILELPERKALLINGFF